METPIIQEFDDIDTSELIKSFFKNYKYPIEKNWNIAIYKQDFTGNWTTFMELMHYGSTRIPYKYFSNPETYRRVPGIDRDPYRHEYIAHIMQVHHVKKIKIVLK